MEKVKLVPSLVYQLNDLVDRLFLAEYFGFKETAHDYVEDIKTFIYSIPHQKSKLCNNKKYGAYYSKYKRNQQTTWYIIFDTEDDFYLIKYITNNHAEDYPKLIGTIF